MELNASAQPERGNPVIGVMNIPLSVTSRIRNENFLYKLEVVIQSLFSNRFIILHALSLFTSLLIVPLKFPLLKNH